MKYNVIFESMKAQALADAVGRPLEFNPNPTPAQVRQSLSSPFLRISDDTQMAMFTMEAMREIMVDWLHHVNRKAEHIYAKHMVEWLNTQHKDDFPQNNTWLGTHRRMQYSAAPGHTCINAIDDLKYGAVPKNTSLGSGIVMKALPFALSLIAIESGELEDIAKRLSVLTHKSSLTNGVVTDYLYAASRFMADGTSEYARNVASKGTTIENHGKGWNARECLQMALWAVGNAESYEELLELSICHGGDSDTVAAVAGGLWGLAGLPIGDEAETAFKQVFEGELVRETCERFDHIVTLANA